MCKGPEAGWSLVCQRHGQEPTWLQQSEDREAGRGGRVTRGAVGCEENLGSDPGGGSHGGQWAEARPGPGAHGRPLRGQEPDSRASGPRTSEVSPCPLWKRPGVLERAPGAPATSAAACPPAPREAAALGGTRAGPRQLPQLGLWGDSFQNNFPSNHEQARAAADGETRTKEKAGRARKPPFAETAASARFDHSAHRRLLNTYYVPGAGVQHGQDKAPPPPSGDSDNKETKHPPGNGRAPPKARRC